MNFFDRKNFFSIYYAPMWLFLVTYVITCLIGAFLAIIHPTFFVNLYTSLSGIKIPTLNNQELITNISLLMVAPMLMFAGFSVITYFKLFSPSKAPMIKSQKPSKIIVAFSQIIFYFLLLIAIFNLHKADSFLNISAWLNYQNWVLARWKVFSAVSFFGFVNIYTLLPLCAAYTMLVQYAVNKKIGLLFWLPMLLTLIANIFLYQKKSPIVAMFIIFSSLYLYSLFIDKKMMSPKKILLTFVIGVTVVYFGAVALPESDITINKISNLKSVDYNLPFIKKTYKADHNIKYFHPNKTITKTTLNCSLLSIFTRTSISAIYYPVVFPKLYSYYGLDIGQDMLGYGKMPDDNLIVWHVMEPKIPGTVTAPYQFVLYSQVGLIRSLLSSLLVGIILAIMWNMICYFLSKRSLWACILGSSILLFSMCIAMDSLRNYLLTSYGIFWGILFITGLFVLTKSEKILEF